MLQLSLLQERVRVQTVVMALLAFAFAILRISGRLGAIVQRLVVATQPVGRKREQRIIEGTMPRTRSVLATGAIKRTAGKPLSSPK